MKRSAKLSDDRTTLTITIGDLTTVYEVIDIMPDTSLASHAFRLVKDANTVHDVSLTEHGAECTCGSFTFRNPERKYCKHLRASIAVGLLPKE